MIWTITLHMKQRRIGRHTTKAPAEALRTKGKTNNSNTYYNAADSFGKGKMVSSQDMKRKGMQHHFFLLGLSRSLRTITTF